MSVADDFESAVARVNALPAPPPQNVQLELYGLFKQAKAGDATGKRPGMMDVRGRAKYDAWAGRRGLSPEQAMQAYIELAKSLG